VISIISAILINNKLPSPRVQHLSEKLIVENVESPDSRRIHRSQSYLIQRKDSDVSDTSRQDEDTLS